MLTALLALTFVCLTLAVVLLAVECHAELRDWQGELDCSDGAEPIGWRHPR